mgnify:CR=1 FL=1
MAITNPTFNLKTGADSDLIVAREVTENVATLGKIKRKDGIFRFPRLTRRTGDTLTGSTENIESNELKHGRTKSAPRKGTSSSSGDINFELSPETFDDELEAVFRGKWKRWRSDTLSPSNKDKNQYQDGFFATKCATSGSGRKLIYDGTGSEDSEGLVHVANNGQGFVIHELNSETNDIKYSFLRKYGGQTGEDLWQEFSHCALNTMQLSVEINSIVTGSFGIMGTNNPKVLDSDELMVELESRLADVEDSDNLRDRGTWAASTAYAEGDIVCNPADGICYKCTTAHTSTDTFTAASWKKLDSYEYVSSIPDKATDTMQFTAREGFLYINGKQIEFAQSLSFNLDNGLSQKFAIFVSNAISTTPLSLDITGDLSTYLVGGKSAAKELFNNAVGDKTVEILFCFQDKLEDPTALYVFQIFNAKHTENTINGNGEDTYDESLPWSSFNEQACRVFRIMLPRVTDLEAQEAVNSGAATGNPNMIAMLPNIELEETDSLSDMVLTSTLNGVDNTADMAFENPVLVTDENDDNHGLITAKFKSVTQTAEEQVVSVTVSWKGNEFTKSFRVPATSV